MIPPTVPLVFSLIAAGACMSATDQTGLTLESWGNGAPELSLSVPLGFSVQKQKGPDFDVHYVTSKDPDDPVMGLYVGLHPNTFSSQRKGIATTREKDAILGRTVEWTAWKETQDGKTVYRCETVVEGAFKAFKAGGVEALRIHVFIKGSSPQRVESLRQASRSLRIIPKR